MINFILNSKTLIKKLCKNFTILCASFLLLTNFTYSRFYNTVPFVRGDVTLKHLSLDRNNLEFLNTKNDFYSKNDETNLNDQTIQDRRIRHAISAGLASHQLLHQLINTNTDNANPAFHTHLIALRPDYVFRNVANVLRNFFDSIMDAHKPGIITFKMYYIY